MLEDAVEQRGVQGGVPELRLPIGHAQVVGHEHERREQAFEDVQLDGEAAVVGEQEARQERLELAPVRAGTAENCKRTVAPPIERLVENAGNVKIKPPGGAETGRNGAAGRELELKHDVATKAERRGGREWRSGGGLWGPSRAVRWAQRDLTRKRTFPSDSHKLPPFPLSLSADT